MKRCFAVAALAIASLVGSAAHAADFSDRLANQDAQFVPPWEGAYFGVNAGYSWGRITNFGGDPTGGYGGAQAGYSWQRGQFVFGGESDLQLSAADVRFAGWQFANPWFGTTRARAGFAMNNVLFYATAGLAYGGVRMELAGLRESHMHVGWAAGAGMEFGLSRKWSARAEYMMMDLSDRGYVMTGTTNGLEANLLRFGVNYRF
ncbi:MAG: porin family protein [Rhizobiales bacterium]|nr:porin family protein [Hyphomicrobiales bacterium]